MLIDKLSSIKLTSELADFEKLNITIMTKLIGFLLLFFAVIAPMAAQEDSEGCKDPALFTRMPNFHIYRCENLQFDKYEFWISDGIKQAVEGHYSYINYYLNENSQAPSGLQIVRNYTNALKKIGGKIIYEYDDGGIQNSIVKLVKDKMEIWTHIMAGGNGMYTAFCKRCKPESLW